MRQPTKSEARQIDLVHAEAAVAAAEHDLYVIDLREKYLVLRDDVKLQLNSLSQEERAQLASKKSAAERAGTQARLLVEQLRLACEASKDALLVDGAWHSPVTKRPYPAANEGGES